MKKVFYVASICLFTVSIMMGICYAENQFDFYPNKAQYRPSEKVGLILKVIDPSVEEVNLQLSISHLNHELFAQSKKIKLKSGQETIAFYWYPPLSDFAGYGADLKIKDAAGKVIKELSTAFDVASDWTKFPRYGFVSDFSPGTGKADIRTKMQNLAKYHINGLQFYDWMYRHDKLISPTEIFNDPLGRMLSLQIVKDKIEIAKDFNIASMAYAAIYASSKKFYQEHPDWGLYDLRGQPITFADGWLYIMNISPGSPWNNHLIKQFKDAIREVGFDGIHLDQYGYPEVGFSHLTDKKERIFLDTAFRDFINQTSDMIKTDNDKAKVVFNAVNNWPIEEVASSKEDIVYIEVWPPHFMYLDLVELIDDGRRLGGGKPVVLAAYIDPYKEIAVRIANAIIFSQGGFHIELGEGNGMLADPYFPKYKEMSPELSRVMRNYYDFAVRYENLLSDSNLKPILAQLEMEDVITSVIAGFDLIFITTKEINNYEVLNLVNLYNMGFDWKEHKQTPPPQFKNKEIKYYGCKGVKNVYWSTPDGSPGLKKLSFIWSQDDKGKYIKFVLPLLEYWDLIVIDKE